MQGKAPSGLISLHALEAVALEQVGNYRQLL